MIPINIIKFFVSYIFIVYLFDVINFSIFLYNFGQTLRWLDSPKFLESLIIWNGGNICQLPHYDARPGLLLACFILCRACSRPPLGCRGSEGRNNSFFEWPVKELLALVMEEMAHAHAQSGTQKIRRKIRSILLLFPLFFLVGDEESIQP